jgi:C-terminal processing protease CtpA/Prc
MFQWRLLKGDIAYLSLDEFADDRAVKAFERAWPQIRQARGLIFDVRRNGGGSSRPGQIILSYLSQQPISGAHSTTRIYSPAAHANGETWMSWRSLPDTDEPFEQPHTVHFDGPVAVLIGPRTFSAAEDFAMMFDAMQRGVLVGETTGGSTGSPLQFELPGGGNARICAKRDVYPDGREFVGKGIAPDIAVTPTVADIRAGRDPVLERAVAALRKRPATAVPAGAAKP